MKKEWLLLSGIVVVTLLISLGVLRWLATGLLGVPADLELVQIDKKVPPFYEGVFRTEDYQATDELLKDPLARERDIARLPFAGEISEVRPDRFGPGVLAGKSQ